jgi:hypothetical protein
MRLFMCYVDCKKMVKYQSHRAEEGVQEENV